ncbi:zinc finger, CCHC-type containing protein [Tanacetum coccineum]
MAGNTVKEMTTNFGKLDKFEGHDFRRWQKKMHFLLTTLKVVYVLTTPMPELLEDATVEAIRRRAKWENDDYICRGHILNGMSDSLFDVYTNVESAKELWDSLESKYMAEDSSSKKFLVSNFNNYKMVDSRPVMEQYNELLRILGQYTQHGLKMDESISVSSIIDKLPPSWKDFKHTLKHGKDDLSLVQLGSHLRIEESLRAQDSDKGKVVLVRTRNQSWNVGNVSRQVTLRGIAEVVEAIAWWIDSSATTHVCKDRCWFKTFEPVKNGSVLYMGDEHFTHVHGKGSVVLEFSSVKTVTLFNLLYVPKLRFGYYNNARLGQVHYKRMLEMFKDDLIPAIDEHPEKYKGCEYYDPVFFQSVGIIYETTAPYTPQQNGVAKRKNRALKEMVNSMLSYSGLSEGFWGEAMAVVRLPDSKRKTLGEKGIDCIFVGYAEHSKAYRFYVIEPNDSVSINSIIESIDAIFDENHFSSIPRLKDIIPNLEESQRDDHSDDVPSETTKPYRGKRARKAKSYGSNFQLYLVEGSRDQVGSQYSYCYSIEEDPRTYNEAMQSRDAAFWKEAIDDEIGSIMENNTWVLSDLPYGCKLLGFRQKEGIDYFDTYAPVARITTIRLLLALATIHNLVIHQMDVKTAFLNGDLDEEVYMKQPEGFVMPDNEHKVCKLVKSLYRLKQAPKQWHQKFNEVVLLSGFHLSKSDKCVYSKFDSSGKGVIICLYVDDMLIFRTDQNQVDKTKKFLSSRYSVKDMGEADIILDCSPVSTPMDPIEKLKPHTGKPVDQLEYSRAIGCLMYAMTSTRPNIAYAIGRLNKFTSNPSRQHWKAITRVFKYLRDTSSTSGWVFLLGGGAISWAFKKQTCITGSTMEFEFAALAAAGKEAEWLRNLIHEIPIWPKPIAPISI